jgi:hypothetical protein
VAFLLFGWVIDVPAAAIDPGAIASMLEAILAGIPPLVEI